MTDKRIAIVGTGLVGRAWAITFARGGCPVVLFDPVAGQAEAALELIEAALGDLDRLGLLQGTAPATVMARLSVAGDLAAALDAADYVQESAPEVLEVKRALFAEMDAAAKPATVLASSSSGFVPSLFSEGLPGRRRCLVAHPLNPPYLTPAVELVPAPWTDPAVMAAARELMERVGQAPLTLGREIEGFVMNRLQSALLHEAFRLVAEGYVSPGDIDRAVGQGLGLRWSFMGPFETIDLNAPGGVRDYVERYGGLYRRISETQKEPADWTAALEETIEPARRAALAPDDIAARQAWRDRRMMALAAHKREPDERIGT